MAVFLSTTISSDEAMDTIKDIRQIAGKQCFVSSMSAYITDLKDLAEAEAQKTGMLRVQILFEHLLPFCIDALVQAAHVQHVVEHIVAGEHAYMLRALPDPLRPHRSTYCPQKDVRL